MKSRGHVLSVDSLKEVKLSAFWFVTKNDKIVIHGSEDEVGVLWEKMEEEKAKGDNGKKSKKLSNVNEEKKKKHRIELVKGDGNGVSKKFEAMDTIQQIATKAVYGSIFTTAKKLNSN